MVYFIRRSRSLDQFSYQDMKTGDVNGYPRLPCLQDTREWAYPMRRSMQEILPGIFLGPYSAAVKSKLSELKNYGITHIICIRHNLEAQFIRPNFEDHFKYLILDIADSCTENIIQYFPVVRAFIDETLERNGKVLVHGNSGISRSAALVLAYIMEKYGLTLKDAYTFVQLRRFCIHPNEGFMAQLREYEPIYQANRMMLNGQSSCGSVRRKRTCDEIDI